MMTHLSLFSGIGGLDIAAEWAGFVTVGQCEYADYPTKVLERHWPDVPRWRDIKTLDKESFYERTGLSTVDVVSGGFPCQPFSLAGKKLGSKDERFLWPEMLRVISEIKPSWVVGENVPGIDNGNLDAICASLEAENYTVVGIYEIPALLFGAPHQRYRTVIIANTESKPRIQEDKEAVSQGSDFRAWALPGGGAWDDVSASYWDIHQPPIPGMVNGLSVGMDEHRARCMTLGNAVVPQQFYPFFLAISRLLPRRAGEKKI